MDVTAGWYPDPDDPTNLRWWDGAVWTDHRQPLDPAAATGAVPTTTSSDEQNAVTEMTAVPPPPATPDTSPFVPLSPAPGPAAAGAGSKKKPLIIVGVIAVLALIAGGAFLFLGGDSAEYTWEGENITDLDVTLEEADEIFLDGVADRNGSVTDDSRCYVVQSADDEADRPSDVLDFLRCGPVLFVDNDPDDGVWIAYALVADDDVVLTVADQPQSSQPSRYDSDDETMSRPDGESPPEGDGGVEPPDPPAAEPGTFLAQDPALDDLELESSYLRAVGLTKSVTLAGVGEPSRFGFGDSARSPAEDERFIAFEVFQGQGDDHYGTSSEQYDRFVGSAGTVSLDVDGEQTVLYEGDDDEVGTGRFLVSVPEAAETVDIVLVDSDVTQRLSLLDESRVEGNIQVLARDTREVDLAAAQAFPVTLSHPDGSVQNDTFTATIEAAELLYYVDDVPGLVPSGPDKAFLVIHHFITSDQTGITPEDDIALEPGHLHLETEGGTVLEAINLAPNDGDLLVGFEVSGAFEAATLSISGAAPSGEISIDLGQPDFRVPIAIDNF